MTSKALLISGYHALSQKHWADYVVQTCSDYNWNMLALPARYFSWRMRGAPLSLAALNSEMLSEHYDLIVATSTVDLSVVQSLYPTLRNTFSLLYFHENQFAYPQAHTPQSVVDWQMVNLYSALRADKVVFNSQYNQASLLDGINALLTKLPDLVPKNIAQSIVEKSIILPVPIRDAAKPPRRPESQSPLKILWNHRWEWDKQPELLLAIVEQLEASGLNFQLILTGQQFRNTPPAMEQLLSTFKHRIYHAGFIEDDADYRHILQQCHVALSTAIHEFQGIAVLEAVSQGCIPLLPARLSYPEFFDSDFLYSNHSNVTKQAKSAVNKITHWLAHGFPKVPAVDAFYESSLTGMYRKEISHKAI